MTVSACLKRQPIPILQSGYKLIRKESEEELCLLSCQDLEEGVTQSDSGHKEGDAEEVMIYLISGLYVLKSKLEVGIQYIICTL